MCSPFARDPRAGGGKGRSGSEAQRSIDADHTMDRHHMRRRDDAGFSRHGCNVCGKDGCRAATCMNGSMDWFDRFGIDAFVPKRPYYDIKTHQPPDYASIEAQARQYAKAKAAAAEVNAEEAGKKIARELETQDELKRKAALAALVAKNDESALPEGWKQYTDKKSGKTYYHNKAKGLTQWKKPTA